MDGRRDGRINEFMGGCIHRGWVNRMSGCMGV